MEENTEVMTKQEFLDSLRAALSGRVSTRAVAENISFYEDYINTQVRMGKSEAQVIEELGDPRLLAKTITEAEKRAGTSSEPEAEYRTANSGYSYRAGQRNGYETGQRSAYGYSYETGQHSYGAGRRNGYRTPLWLVIGIILLVVVLILSFVFSVISFLAPVLIPIMLVVLTVRLFRRLL